MYTILNEKLTETEIQGGSFKKGYLSKTTFVKLRLVTRDDIWDFILLKLGIRGFSKVTI